MFKDKKLILLFTFLLISVSMFSQTGCPRGNVINCKGMCGFYRSHNKYGYCDYSVLSDDIKKIIYGVPDTVKKDVVVEVKSNDTVKKEDNKNDKVVKKHDNKVNNQEIKANGNNIPTTEFDTNNEQKGQNAEINNDSASLNNPPAPTSQNFSQPYDFISIFGVCLAFYLFTYFLSRKSKIRKVNHKKIWNVLLLITFLVTGLLGLFMVVQLNYRFEIEWFRSLLYWHVEFGIAMAAISIFHVLWHLKYYVNLFRKEKKHDKHKK